MVLCVGLCTDSNSNSQFDGVTSNHLVEMERLQTEVGGRPADQYVKPPLFAVCSGYKPQKTASHERASADRERQNGNVYLTRYVLEMSDMQEESLFGDIAREESRV